MEQTQKRILRIADVCGKVGLSRSLVYQLAAVSQFPSPIKLGEKSSGWLESEIDAWIDARVAASRGQ